MEHLQKEYTVLISYNRVPKANNTMVVYVAPMES